VDRVLQVLAGLQLIEQPNHAFTPTSPNAAAQAIAGSALKCWEWTNEVLTPLGTVLSNLPIAPTLGKMLVLGAAFGCLEPLLIIAATLESRSIFQAPMHAREALCAVKQQLDPMSDHLASLKAVQRWKIACDDCPAAARAYIEDHSLSKAALIAVTQSIQHLRTALSSCGLVRKSHGTHANNMALVKAVIAASLYPNVATVTLGPNKKNGEPGIDNQTIPLALRTATVWGKKAARKVKISISLLTSTTLPTQLCTHLYLHARLVTASRLSEM
jgi:HrpA-like RNA helicase